MRRVATAVPSTAGMPYSRATIEPCESGPPISVTTADAMAKSGVQVGSCNIRGDFRRDVGVGEESANRSRSSFERGGKRGVCILESRENLWLKVIGIHEYVVGIRRNVESIRYGESSLDHFASDKPLPPTFSSVAEGSESFNMD